MNVRCRENDEREQRDSACAVMGFRRSEVRILSPRLPQLFLAFAGMSASDPFSLRLIPGGNGSVFLCIACTGGNMLVTYARP